jgi:hypothetical protein
MGLIVSVPDDSIQLIGYTETGSNIKDTTIYEYHIRSTISMCESVEGQALRALEASIQSETYDEVLSQFLGRVVGGVSGRFTSTRSALLTSDIMSMTSLMGLTGEPTTSPTRPPTRVTEKCKIYRYFEMSQGG